jgi:hypothetical protein
MLASYGSAQARVHNAAGNHTLSASFAGDLNSVASALAPMNETVNRTPPIIAWTRLPYHLQPPRSPIDEDAGAIGSVTVLLVNAQGPSQPATAQ